MSITDVFRVGAIKADLQRVREERDRLKDALAQTQAMDFAELKKTIADLEAQKAEANREAVEAEARAAKRRRALEEQIDGLNRQIADKKNELVILDDEILLQSFGFYRLRYSLENSEAYRTRLEQTRKKQEAMVKGGKAAYCTGNWTVDNSQKEGERMVRDYVKLILRSFNNECDASIINVKFNNVDSIEKKIRGQAETLPPRPPSCCISS